MTVAMAGVPSWSDYAPLLALAGFRIFAVIVVYKYQMALINYKSDELQLRLRKCQVEPCLSKQMEPPRHLELNMEKQQEAMASKMSGSRDAFYDIDNEAFQNPKVETLTPENVNELEEFVTEDNNVFYSHYSTNPKQH